LQRPELRTQALCFSDGIVFHIAHKLHNPGFVTVRATITGAVHMKAKHSASSSDEIAVFQAYTNLINSERETLWARHNALLLANSLIIGALAISPAALWENKWAALAMLSAGLLISASWVGIAVQGWSAIRRHADIAGTFASA
jgi:hypothetical protein